MDLGIPAPNITPPQGRESLARVARTAEALGFHSLWLGDHVVYPTTGRADGERYTWDLYEAFVSAGFLAAITERIAIAFGVIVLTYRNPILTAKMVATLDQLTGGRVILGIGPGYLTGEFQALGIPQRETGARTDEYLDLFRALWSHDRPEFHGRFVSFEHAYFRPRPVQPRLPIWIGGFSDAAIRRAVSQGDGWHTPRFTVEAMRPYADQLRDLAAREGRDLTGFTFSNRPAVRFSDRVDDPAALAALAKVGTFGPGREPIVGPPAYVAEQLARFETELGVDHLVLDLHEGDPIDDLIWALETLADQVVPLLPPGRRAAEQEAGA